MKKKIIAGLGKRFPVKACGKFLYWLTFSTRNLYNNLGIFSCMM